MRKIYYILVTIFICGFAWAQEIEFSSSEQTRNDVWYASIDCDLDEINVTQLSNELTTLLGESKSSVHPIWITSKDQDGVISVKFLNGGVFFRASAATNDEAMIERINSVKAAILNNYSGQLTSN